MCCEAKACTELLHSMPVCLSLLHSTSSAVAHVHATSLYATLSGDQACCLPTCPERDDPDMVMFREVLNP